MKNEYTNLQKKQSNLHPSDGIQNNENEYIDPRDFEEKIPPPPYSETIKTPYEIQCYDKENDSINHSSPCYMKAPVCAAAFFLLCLPCILMAQCMDPSIYLVGFFFVYGIFLAWLLCVTYETWTKIFKETMGNISSGVETGVHCSLRSMRSAFCSTKKGIKEAVVTTVSELRKATRS